MAIDRRLLGAGRVPSRFRVAAVRIQRADTALTGGIIATDRVRVRLATTPGDLAGATRGAFDGGLADAVGIPPFSIRAARGVYAADAILTARILASDVAGRTAAISGRWTRTAEDALHARFHCAGVIPHAGAALAVDIAHARTARVVVAARAAVSRTAVASRRRGWSRSARCNGRVRRQRSTRTTPGAFDLCARNAGRIPYRCATGRILPAHAGLTGGIVTTGAFRRRTNVATRTARRGSGRRSNRATALVPATNDRIDLGAGRIPGSDAAHAVRGAHAISAGDVVAARSIVRNAARTPSRRGRSLTRGRTRPDARQGDDYDGRKAERAKRSVSRTHDPNLPPSTRSNRTYQSRGSHGAPLRTISSERITGKENRHPVSVARGAQKRDKKKGAGSLGPSPSPSQLSCVVIGSPDRSARSSPHRDRWR
jgi:hypothetical protein